MSASLKKFTSRAPRYTLRPNDNHYMRFAHNDDHGHIYTTRFIDISLTGLAFVIDREHAPFIYEMIKIEVPLPSGEHVAWWAKVVRIEEFSPQKWYLKKEDFKNEDQILVAVQFKDLPISHVQKIKENLDKKFAEVAAEKRREHMQTLAAIWAHYSWNIIFYVACTLVTFWLLWHFAQPGGNYDPERGSPWGQRYLTWPFSNDNKIWDDPDAEASVKQRQKEEKQSERED